MALKKVETSSTQGKNKEQKKGDPVH